MIVSIEGGTTYLGDDIYRYNWTTIEGEHSVTFFAPVKPQIGDTVDDETLEWRQLEGWKINGDTSRWQPYEDELWPE